MLLFLYILSTLSIQCDNLKNYKTYNYLEIMECVHTIQISSKNKVQMITGLKHLYEQVYAYNDIMKNPPQPSFDSEYYKPNDLIARMDKLDMTDGELYPFYYELKQIIKDAYDLHLSVNLNSVNDKKNKYIIDNIFYFLPFNFNIDENKNTRLSVANISPEILTDDMSAEIAKHATESVVSINGVTPLEFIRTFANKNVGVKSPSGRFSYAQSSMTLSSLNYNPLTEEELSTTFEIKYESGDIVKAPYYFLYVSTSSLSESAQKRLKTHDIGSNYSPLKFKDLMPEEKTRENGKRSDQEGAFKFDFEDITGDYSCKTYNDKKINVLVLKSFSMSNVLAFYSVSNTLLKCAEQFDNNDYPIAVILPLNGGGFINLGLDVEKFLSPHSDTEVITSVRSSDMSGQVLLAGTAEAFLSPENCEKRYIIENGSGDLGDWFYNYQTIDYGNGVLHYRTQPSYYLHGALVQMNLTKHIRKPQDIVVFTDSFCYSTCSFFTKGLVERGEAILVGFSGDPEGDIEHFDVGQAPSSVIQAGDIKDDEQQALKKMGVSAAVTYFETSKFHYDLKETIPREYIADRVDERVNLYTYTNDKTDTFMDKALEIIEKYKTQCNSHNKRLVKETSECDNKMTIKHAHGGYVCGDDNKWTTTCVASYCDEGYKFDYYNQKCIEDVCNLPENDDTWIWITVGVVSGVFVLIVFLILVGVIVFFVMKKKKSKSQYTGLA
ncbi:hypothetical protein EIN_043900 [Entamoeba invadens IP1]|uniref:Uncharacterized protein n=1 Tax=Entamoeba invadens IP1 TaxID=370355 RepID=A0A0A1TZ52_ENTIV|nr:hypothetical protein EIN_043900 [Entamoeba invadens IP1]ELP86842.1 hypothetical protein EIN_043900 [Entamoeba invadens IP1]|eukprot:XP_004253613.1 hypothetical protein EIN_043900 [Entamoeba invadens IP1]